MTKSRILGCVAFLLLLDSAYLAVAGEPSAGRAVAALLHPVLGLVFVILLRQWWKRRPEAAGGVGKPMLPLVVGSAVLGVLLPFLVRVPWRAAVVALHVLAAVAGLAALGWALARARGGAPKTLPVAAVVGAVLLLALHLLPARQAELAPLANPLPPANLEGEALRRRLRPLLPFGGADRGRQAAPGRRRARGPELRRGQLPTRARSPSGRPRPIAGRGSTTPGTGPRWRSSTGRRAPRPRSGAPAATLPSCCSPAVRKARSKRSPPSPSPAPASPAPPATA